MAAPSVSVVLPTYNGAAYVAEAIASVLAQDRDDFELVVCDDGSTDWTPEIVGSFADPRARVYRNDRNLGLFATLNRLVQLASGSRIRFLGQDDRMKSHCLREESAFWDRHPEIALSYCQCDLIDEAGRMIRTAPFDPTPDLLPPWLSSQIAYYHGCLQANIATVTCRRDLLIAAGLFNVDMRVSGDFEMWTRISVAHPIGFVGRRLIELRTHDQQFSRGVGERLFFIREDRNIYAQLLQQLPEPLHDTAAQFDRRRRVWDVNYAVRRLAAGDLQRARDAWRELRATGPVAPIVLRWLLTANGHFFSPVPRYIAPSGESATEPRDLVNIGGRPAL